MSKAYKAEVNTGDAVWCGEFDTLPEARAFVDRLTDRCTRIPRAQIRGPQGFVENQDPGAREPEIDFAL